MTRSRYVLTNARAVLPDRIMEAAAIVIDGARIERVCEMPVLASQPELVALERIDVGGRLTTPGLVDMHVHGANSMTFDSIVPDEPARILDFYAAHGVTTVAASLVSATVPELVRRVENMRSAIENPKPGNARVIGAHLEGPFLSPGQAGAHDPQALTSPSRRDRDAIMEIADLLAMVTLAPELEGAVSLTKTLTEQQVIVAAGHSDARGDALRACIDVGLSHVTHLWSGQSSLVRRGPWRVPGLLEESLASWHLTAEIIADGKHLPMTLIEIARRCLGGRLAVVSDATAGTGLPDGTEYDLGTVRCVVQDGVSMVQNSVTEAFGGSVTPLPAMLAVLVNQARWDEHEAVMAATAVPARILGVGDRLGALQPGYAADIAVFDDGFLPYGTIVRGVRRGFAPRYQAAK